MSPLKLTTTFSGMVTVQPTIERNKFYRVYHYRDKDPLRPDSSGDTRNCMNCVRVQTESYIIVNALRHLTYDASKGCCYLLGCDTMQSGKNSEAFRKIIMPLFREYI
jgi:hypothetical protein